MTDMKREQFKAIDTDNDGFITAKELKASLQGDKGNDLISDEHMATIVSMADNDGDRRINFEEYSAFVR
ncbi:EF-hand domain-containing protein [Streptomyces sp. NPDC048362]|uniref:EF-hand domain-containing protein n=1 Tax=Streptomyces sp. NPDC048362 TaxID=3365539 RepID=UPI0037175A41